MDRVSCCENTGHVLDQTELKAPNPYHNAIEPVALSKESRLVPDTLRPSTNLELRIVYSMKGATQRRGSRLYVLLRQNRWTSCPQVVLKVADSVACHIMAMRRRAGILGAACPWRRCPSVFMVSKMSGAIAGSILREALEYTSLTCFDASSTGSFSVASKFALSTERTRPSVLELAGGRTEEIPDGRLLTMRASFVFGWSLTW